MSFQERALQGDPLGAFRYAAVAGSLWAIGSSWSTAIRQIALRIFPTDTVDVVLAEVISALLTTAIGVAVAILVTRTFRRKRPSHAVTPAATTQRGRRGDR